MPLGEFARVERASLRERQVSGDSREVSCSRTNVCAGRPLPAWTSYQSPVRRPWRKWGRPVCSPLIPDTDHQLLAFEESFRYFVFAVISQLCAILFLRLSSLWPATRESDPFKDPLFHIQDLLNEEKYLVLPTCCQCLLFPHKKSKKLRVVLCHVVCRLVFHPFSVWFKLLKLTSKEN